MDRRDFVKGMAAAGAAMAAGQNALADGGKGGPNVLFILADQMRLPRWFAPEAELPAFESLKARGVSFENHFCSASPCSPSRACIMTGLHPDRHGVQINVMDGHQPSLDPVFPTLGKIFRQAGYRTPYFGKWHLTTRKDEKENGNLQDYGFNWVEKENHPKGQKVWPGMEMDPVYAGAAVKWLHENRRSQKPWFLFLSLLNPHDICYFPNRKKAVDDLRIKRLHKQLPGNFHDDLSQKPACQAEHLKAYAEVGGPMDPNNEREWLRYLDYYYHFNRAADDQMGRVLQALKDTGLDRETLVVFSSDHGEMCGSHGLRSKGPNIYTEGVNVPLVFSLPGVLPEGKTTKALAQNVDLFPTFAKKLSGPGESFFNNYPGRDLWPILENPSLPGSDHVLFTFGANLHVALAAKKAGVEGVESPQNIRSIRDLDWAFARYYDPESGGQEFELYDLKNDPLMMKNLAADPTHAAKREEMAQKLKKAEVEEMGKMKVD